MKNRLQYLTSFFLDSPWWSLMFKGYPYKEVGDNIAFMQQLKIFISSDNLDLSLGKTVLKLKIALDSGETLPEVIFYSSCFWLESI